MTFMEAEARDAVEPARLVDREFDRLYERLRNEEQANAAQWGGFFRRWWALVVDLLVLCLFSWLLFYLAAVGYGVGLAAHDRPHSSAGVLRIVAVAWMFLVCGYFVLLHGLEGKTVGKWVFGLRVVGTGQERIGYLRAFSRFLAAVLSAPLLLGFLWILWSREKRGWHDFLVRTWVIRE